MDTSLDTTPTAYPTLLQSILLILFSELGDKTFLIAALLAMRHPRLTVFLGAFGALALMSFLSAALGHVLMEVQSWVPVWGTKVVAGVLFLGFGGRMVAEGWAMEREGKSGGGGGGNKIEEEMREAEEEIEEDEAKVEGREGGIPLEEMEEGGRARSASRSRRAKETWADGLRNFCSLLLGPVFVQAFVLTFLGEWGDRSQIATIALGAAHNVYLVSLGTILGHSFCTALAVIGGRYVSTKISVRHVTLGGAFLFILFGLIYLYEGLLLRVQTHSEHVPVSSDSASDLLH